MDLSLSDDESRELRRLLDAAVRDLSHEIAATDNGNYRAELRQRRERLGAVLDALGVPV